MMDILSGKQIITKDFKGHHATSILKSKKIIVYFFSAYNADTSVLLESLKNLYEENLEEEFKKCFDQQGPWLAIPFKNAICDELRWMYDITYIPQLVVVKKDGSIISKRGKEELEKLGINVLAKMDMLEGKKVITRDCQSHPVARYFKTTKIIIYYFSASWANQPDLLERLKNLYQENLNRNTCMEVVYVSADTEEKSFSKHFKEHGPWVAIPFKNSILADEIRYRYDITCMPQMVVVKKDGYVISRRGKEELEKLDINVLVTWTDYE
ncbi:hypothetical protein NQ317_006494 [Molorchus minor]|uniref:Thioredoxin-like fold domain-containing protein n=1 Tax=Molorchus minor TaxID=1323400 RepID=A0ABQ9IXE8_9CUCU|nr:hypothetical protein NQ317_006494 [Molorchus minor]